MNPSLKSASMLLEIQIMFNFYQKSTQYAQLLNIILKKYLQTKRIQEHSKRKKSLLKMYT